MEEGSEELSAEEVISCVPLSFFATRRRADAVSRRAQRKATRVNDSFGELMRSLVAFIDEWIAGGREEEKVRFSLRVLGRELMKVQVMDIRRFFKPVGVDGEEEEVDKALALKQMLEVRSLSLAGGIGTHAMAEPHERRTRRLAPGSLPRHLRHPARTRRFPRWSWSRAGASGGREEGSLGGFWEEDGRVNAVSFRCGNFFGYAVPASACRCFRFGLQARVGERFVRGAPLAARRFRSLLSSFSLRPIHATQQPACATALSAPLTLATLAPRTLLRSAPVERPKPVRPLPPPAEPD